jgi:hypothetical protein
MAGTKCIGEEVMHIPIQYLQSELSNSVASTS